MGGAYRIGARSEGQAHHLYVSSLVLQVVLLARSSERESSHVQCLLVRNETRGAGARVHPLDAESLNSVKRISAFIVLKLEPKKPEVEYGTTLLWSESKDDLKRCHSPRMTWMLALACTPLKAMLTQRFNLTFTSTRKAYKLISDKNTHACTL